MYLMLILGQVKITKGWIYPAGLGQGPTGLQPPACARNKKKKYKTFQNFGGCVFQRSPSKHGKASNFLHNNLEVLGND